VTSTSGGYSVPVPQDGNYSITFSVSGSADVHLPAAVTFGNNFKLDRALTYTPPVITGSDKPAVNQNNTYFFSSVPGAAGYQWKQESLTPATAVEGAENGLANVTAVTSPGYSVIDSNVRASGAHSFHMAHPASSNSPPVDQILRLNPTFQAGPTAVLVFASRLGRATPDEVAHAQVSTDDGQSWQDVWTQAGTGDAGETDFTAQSVDLAAYAGMDLQVRFVYSVNGSFFPQTFIGVGLYLDNIGWQGVDLVGGEMVQDIASGSSFVFSPAQAVSYGLSVRAQLPGRFLPWGPGRTVTAQVGSLSTPTVQISTAHLLPNASLEIDFSVANPGSGVYGVQSTSALGGAWADEPGASVQSISGAANLRAVLPVGSEPKRFFRIVAK
jgi:hypothetical protein